MKALWFYRTLYICLGLVAVMGLYIAFKMFRPYNNYEIYQHPIPAKVEDGKVSLYFDIEVFTPLPAQVDLAQFECLSKIKAFPPYRSTPGPKKVDNWVVMPQAAIAELPKGEPCKLRMEWHYQVNKFRKDRYEIISEDFVL